MLYKYVSGLVVKFVINRSVWYETEHAANGCHPPPLPKTLHVDQLPVL